MTEETQDPADVEAAARLNGWVPPDEWKSDKPPPGGFLTAEEFERRGNEIRPILSSKLKKQDEELATLRAEISGIRQTAQKFEQFSSAAMERERREREQAVAQLEAMRAQAITDGDGQAAVRAERQIRTLEAAPAPEAQPPPQLDPEVANRWVRDNDWYGSDQVMRNWAEGRSKELLRQGVPPGEAVLSAISREARESFPDRFDRGTTRTSSVEGNGRRSPQTFRRTFDDLPADAKKAFDEFKSMGVSMTKQQYLDRYEWE